MSLAALQDSTPYHVAAGIVQKLHAHGHVAYFAGGCIRDALRGVPPKDIDIATSATPDQVQALYHRTIPVGIQFGVVRVLMDEMEFEVATFRSDGVYLDGRRPEEIQFSTPEQDALRRDFTINGMFLDPLNGEILDFVGGRADLDAKILRAIGDRRTLTRNTAEQHCGRL